MPKLKDTGSGTGTSTDAGVLALDWDCGNIHYKTLLLENTHGANDIDYSVAVYAEYNGRAHVETSGTLTPGDTARIALNNFYARVVVTVSSTVGGSHGTYQIDRIGVTP